MSIGAYRVSSSRPSNNPDVAKITSKAAELIDLINGIDVVISEQVRLKALAMRAIEEGTMWAVKAATKKEVGVTQ